MSIFSEQCKFYVEDSGLTLYEFSKKSGIERTTLYRMINGKRVPSKEIFYNFVLFCVLIILARMRYMNYMMRNVLGEGLIIIENLYAL